MNLDLRIVIKFEFYKSEIMAESIHILDEITDAMMVIPRLRLEIQGHTDNRGTQEYNLNLEIDDKNKDDLIQNIINYWET